jgi:hypothetical protein
MSSEGDDADGGLVEQVKGMVSWVGCLATNKDPVKYGKLEGAEVIFEIPETFIGVAERLAALRGKQVEIVVREY